MNSFLILLLIAAACVIGYLLWKQKKPVEKHTVYSCPQCGNTFTEPAHFCPKCGYDLSKKPKEDIPEPVTPKEKKTGTVIFVENDNDATTDAEQKKTAPKDVNEKQEPVTGVFIHPEAEASKGETPAIPVETLEDEPVKPAEVKEEKREASNKTEIIQEPKEYKLNFEVKINSTVSEAEISKFPCVIGREVGECDFLIVEGAVSRHHAVIEKQDDGFSIRDLGAANGVYVNEVKVAKDQCVPLHTGDKIRIGRAVLTVL